jgi:hypothetical protein
MSARIGSLVERLRIDLAAIATQGFTNRRLRREARLLGKEARNLRAEVASLRAIVKRTREIAHLADEVEAFDAIAEILVLTKDARS